MNQNYELLCYIFSCYVFLNDVGIVQDNSSHFWYSMLLSEIEQIESGRLERNEESGLVDLSDPGELIVYKDTTILRREVEGKYLEIPTSQFKQLVKDWIKFIDVNIKAFAPRNS